MPDQRQTIVLAPSSDKLTEEKARLVSKANVLAALEVLCTTTYGIVPEPRYAAAAATPRISGSATHGKAENYLRLAWHHELQLRVPYYLGVAELLRVTAPGQGPPAYYSLFNAVCALAEVRGMPVDRHDKAQRTFSTQYAQWMPLPWSLRLAGDPGDLASCTLLPKGSLKQPLPVVEPLRTRTHSELELVFAGLRMAHRWKLERAGERWKQSNRNKQGKPYKRLPTGQRSKLIAKTWPTTLLDLAYQLRLQTNYREVEDYLSTAEDWNFQDFHRGIVFLCHSGLLGIELQVARCLGFADYRAIVKRYLTSVKDAGRWAEQPLTRRLKAIEGCLAL